MPRTDICDYLIHFTRGETDSYQDAFERLQAIIATKSLIGSAGLIRGGYKCICFSEVPLEHLSGGLVNPDYYSKYSPFGIMVKKNWLYAQGGRPAIYQHDNEFEMLPESHRWRHVRYEPGTIDFTWEREWRVHTDRLPIDPSVARIVVKNREWTYALIDIHDEMGRSQIRDYSTIFNEAEASMLFEEPFGWLIYTLT